MFSLSVLHGYENAEPQRLWGHNLDLFESHVVIGQVTFELNVGTFLFVVNGDHAFVLNS